MSGEYLSAKPVGGQVLEKASPSEKADDRRASPNDTPRAVIASVPGQPSRLRFGRLWTPNERGDLWRWFWLPKGHRNIERRDEIEDWFKTLADARNDVIHRGSLKNEVYQPPLERPMSRYVGHLLWVGERVLREAIKAKLGPDVLLCGALARRAWAKATFGDLARELAAKARAAAKAGTLTQPVEAHSPRALSKLLASLGVPTANLVVVDTLGHLAAGYTHEATARRGQSRMLITQSEFAALREAGAEDQFSHSWDPCP